MLSAAGSPDSFLTAHLESGFPLVGILPAGGNEEACEPWLERAPSALWRGRAGANADVLQRAARSGAADQEVQAAFLAKAQEEAIPLRLARPSAGVPRAREVDCGKAVWIPLREAVADCVLTPRFPVDEGYKLKADGSSRRKARRSSFVHAIVSLRPARGGQVRCIDAFSASGINAASAMPEKIRRAMRRGDRERVSCLTAGWIP